MLQLHLSCLATYQKIFERKLVTDLVLITNSQRSDQEDVCKLCVKKSLD